LLENIINMKNLDKWSLIKEKLSFKKEKIRLKNLIVLQIINFKKVLVNNLNLYLKIYHNHQIKRNLKILNVIHKKLNQMMNKLMF